MIKENMIVKNLNIKKIPTISNIHAMPEYGLRAADFYPIQFLNEKAEEINNFCLKINESNIEEKEDLIQLMDEFKQYLCSSLFPDGQGNLTRLFFNNPNNLVKFLQDKQDKND